MPAGLAPVYQLPTFDLVKKCRRNKGFNEAGRLELDILVDRDELLAGGEIINRPSGSLVRVSFPSRRRRLM
jgi:hypothetical protein